MRSGEILFSIERVEMLDGLLLRQFRMSFVQFV
ncbi:unnamed protein product [Larinioides sclopetarius]|uniref:Uncharacterized protein n=1 Tax=Larinioides sclopetarius TaxID=280406 RepID=A0AAV1ZLI2_9ARAC